MILASHEASKSGLMRFIFLGKSSNFSKESKTCIKNLNHMEILMHHYFG